MFEMGELGLGAINRLSAMTTCLARVMSGAPSGHSTVCSLTAWIDTRDDGPESVRYGVKPQDTPCG